MKTWTSSDPRWQALSQTERAAAMALMEANARNPDDAKHVLGAIINRSQKTGDPLGDHVSKPIYQPTIEPSQQARLDGILRDPNFQTLKAWAERRLAGQEPDPVQGATHFLAPESTMLALERKDPNKYKNWGPRGANWTGYDPATGSYKGVVMRDGSHAFLAPDGSYNAPRAQPSINGGYGVSPTGAAGVSGPIQTANPTSPDTLKVFNDTGPAKPKETLVAGSSAPMGGDAGGLLAGLFGDGGNVFQSLMASTPPPAPKVETAEIPTVPVRQVDPAQLLAIVQRRQKLGSA